MIDKYGLIVQSNGDGGDCPHRCGVVLAGYSITSPTDAPPLYQAIMNNLQIRDNVFVRYWIQYNSTADFSRDQASRLMLGFGMNGYSYRVSGYYKLLLKNGLKHQNGDYIGTGEPGNIIRALDLWYLYPLLMLLDFKFLGDIIARKINPWGYDALYLPDLYYAQKKYWTPAAWLSKVILMTFFFDDVVGQITANLINPAICNPCEEAGDAMLSILNNLKGN